MFAGSIGGGGWFEVVESAVRKDGGRCGEISQMEEGGCWCVEYGRHEIHFHLKLVCLGLSITTYYLWGI